MPRASRAFVALIAALTITAAACSDGGQRPSLAGERTPESAASDPGRTTVAELAPGTSLTAQAAVPVVRVYDAPAATTPSREFPNPWFVNDDARYPLNTIFLVEKQRGNWLEVLLPVRPNGSTGWIRLSDVRLVPNPFRIEVDLSDHALTVYDSNRVFLEDTVAVGKAETPTPVGKFFIRVLLQAPDPTTVYGPYAYGLSSHSETLTEFNGGDAEIGIHGNNDASVLGQNISAGCIRMANDKISRLAGILPLGTPVEVRG